MPTFETEKSSDSNVILRNVKKHAESFPSY